MIYIINYEPDGVFICRGHNELTDCINHMFRRNWTMINSIIPLHYCKSLYMVYEFDMGIYCTEPIKREDLFKEIDNIKAEKGNIIHIYPHKETNRLEDRYTNYYQRQKHFRHRK